MSVFCAKIKVKPTKTVTANFTTTKAGRSELTKPDNTGLSSRVPKYRVPITVVKQSMMPIKDQKQTWNSLCTLQNRLSPFFF